MRTIAVVNQKGGCGKTITSINLSAFLALARRRVLLVDMDPQGHSTLGLSPGGPPAARTMYDVLLAETRRPPTTIADIACPVGESFDLAPSDIRLSAVPEALAGMAGWENILARALAGLSGRYDYVIVDCPPTVGLLTFNALKACREAKPAARSTGGGQQAFLRQAVQRLRQVVAGNVERGRDLIDADRGLPPVGQEDERAERVFSGLREHISRRFHHILMMM